MTGIVLVGGRSRRMGADKALLPFGGGVVVEAVVEALRAAGCDPVILAGRPEAYTHLGLPTVADTFPGAGPLAGLEAGLANAPTVHACVTACDLPLVRPELLRLLMGLAPGWEAVVPAVGPGGWQPLCAVYAKGCAAAAAESLRDGDARLTDFLRRLRVLAVDEAQLRAVDPDLISFTNVNTPIDLDLARAALARHRPRTNGQ